MDFLMICERHKKIFETAIQPAINESIAKLFRQSAIDPSGMDIEWELLLLASTAFHQGTLFQKEQDMTLCQEYAELNRKHEKAPAHGHIDWTGVSHYHRIAAENIRERIFRGGVNNIPPDQL